MTSRSSHGYPAHRLCIVVLVALALVTAPALAGAQAQRFSSVIVDTLLDVRGRATIGDTLTVGSDALVRGNRFCVGPGYATTGDCPLGLSIRQAQPGITLDDTGPGPTIKLYTLTGPTSGFAVGVGATQPFVITAGAPDSSLVVGGDGRLGGPGGTLTLGATEIAGALAVTGASTVGGNLQVTGTGTIGGDLNVGAPGAGTVLGVTGSLSVVGEAGVTGPLSVAGRADVSGPLSVTGASRFDRDVTVNGALTSSSLNVGALNVNSLAVAAGATLGGDLGARRVMANSASFNALTVGGNARVRAFDATGSGSVRGDSLCVGRQCSAFGGGVPSGLTIHQQAPEITLRDTTTGAPEVRLMARSHAAAGLFVEVGENVELAVREDGRVAIGHQDPQTQLHVRGNSPATAVRVTNDTCVPTPQDDCAPAARYLLQLHNHGAPQILLRNTDTGISWASGVSGDTFIVNRAGNEGVELALTSAGNLRIKGTLAELSDRAAKRDLVPVDGDAVLAKVMALPIATWRYADDSSDAVHLGPMAQDFHAAFGLGADERHISPRDAASVALAAVKALAARLQERDAEIAELKAAVSQMLK